MNLTLKSNLIPKNPATLKNSGTTEPTGKQVAGHSKNSNTAAVNVTSGSNIDSAIIAGQDMTDSNPTYSKNYQFGSGQTEQPSSKLLDGPDLLTGGSMLALGIGVAVTGISRFLPVGDPTPLIAASLAIAGGAGIAISAATGLLQNAFNT